MLLRMKKACERILLIAIPAGFLVLLLGITLPTSKLYHQLLAIVLWLPALLSFWIFSGRVKLLLKQPLAWMILLFALWSSLTLIWSHDVNAAKHIKYIGYVLLSVWGVSLLSIFPGERGVRLFQIAAAAMAIVAFIFIVRLYIILGYPWLYRIYGVWQLEHPILAAHAFGFFAVGLFFMRPAQRIGQIGWLLALLVLFTYLLMAQTKGVWLAVGIVILLAPLWRKEKLYYLCSMAFVVCVLAAAFTVPDFMFQRGYSLRPELFSGGIDILLEKGFFSGAGLGAEVKILVPGGGLYDHPHNLFLDIALQLGIVGLILWCAVWALTGFIGWRHRDSSLGAALVGIWIFATICVLTDGAGIWAKPREIWFLTWIPVGIALLLGTMKSRTAD